MRAFELNTDNMLEGLPPLLPGGHGVWDFQQECHILTCRTIEHFSTLKQSIFNEPWSTEHDGASGPCSHMASFLLGPFSNVSDAVSSKGLRIRRRFLQFL